MTRHHWRPSLPVCLLCLSAILFFGCSDGGDSPAGLRRSLEGNGPRIVFDPLAEPTPDIPLPNDIATVMDSAYPTGRRLNIRSFAPTQFERDVRRHLDEIDGFGTFSPITIAFDRPIDLSTAGPGTVMLINLNPDSDRFGRLVPLDFGSGNYPVFLERPWRFPVHDRYRDAYNLLFNPFFEDTGSDGIENDLEPGWLPTGSSDPSRDNYHPLLNPGGTEGNGVLDPGEPDYDLDGELDLGNRIDWNGNGILDCGEDFNCNRIIDPGEDVDRDGTLLPCEFTTHYEVESNTLIVRPVVPLEQETAYAVVITSDLTGLGPDGVMGGGDGEPVRSPFPYVNHAAQTKRLRPITPILHAMGRSLEEVAFAWIFTTQSTTRLLEAVRDGLSGEGPFGYLPYAYPPLFSEIKNLDITLDGDLVSIVHPEVRDNVFILQGAFLESIIQLVGSYFVPGEGLDYLSLKYVDYLVIGNFETPNFRATEDEIIQADWLTGRAELGREEVPFVLFVPRTCDPAEHPFPVSLYCHGNESVRFEGISIANALARHGIATAAIDAVGHGPIISEGEILKELDGLGLPAPLQTLLFRLLARLLGVGQGVASMDRDEILDHLLSVGFIEAILVDGRSVDVSGDGWPDNGEIFFTADTLRTRDVLRQTVIDLMQLKKILQNFDPSAVPPAVANPEKASPEELLPSMAAGDFNADGILDVGGPDVTYYQTGISMGGIVSSVLMGVDKDIVVGAPVVPGGGYSDVMLRSTLKSVMDRVYYQITGPLIAGEEDASTGLFSLRMIAKFEEMERDLGLILIPSDGSLRLFNPVNGEEKWAILIPDPVTGLRRFTAGVPADAGDPIEITSYDGLGRPVYSLTAEATYKGFGIDRNTKRYREFFGISQITLDPADPVNYAPHWFLDPLPGVPPKRILQVSVPGDYTLPINNQVALARAGGLLGPKWLEPGGGLLHVPAPCDGYPADLSECESISVPPGGDPDHYRYGDCDCMNLKLIERKVMLGVDTSAVDPLYDVDDFAFEDPDGDNCDDCEAVRPGYCDHCAAIGPVRPVNVDGAGVAAVRFPFAGIHEFFGYFDASNPDPNVRIHTPYYQNKVACFFANHGERLLEHPFADDGPDCD